MVFQDLLELLRRNKQYPNYAAERRIDIFINFFLEDMLSAHYKEKVKFVAPEFPLKKDESSNRNVKLDYLCAFEKTKQPIFIELKTDTLYFNNEQARFYAKRAESWPSCIDDLKGIIINSRMRFSFREKYFYLIRQLFEAGLIYSTGESANESFDQSKDIMTRWNGVAELLYIGPDNDALRTKIKEATENKGSLLDFTQIAELQMRSNIPHALEFKQLMEFLSTLE